MVQSLCAAYHLPLREAMRMTLPQIIMLNHAAWAEHENAERRYEAKKKAEEKKNLLDPEIEELGGVRMSELQQNPEAFDAYMADIGNAFG